MLRYDREVKLPLYVRHGILKVWLVDVAHQQSSLFRKPKADGYQYVTSPASLGLVTPERLFSARVDLTRLFQPIL
jgi:Uma2 family endonuclease